MLIWTDNSTLDATYMHIIINNYSHVLSYVDSAINLWIYIVSGARFRTEFLAMIGIKKDMNT